MQKKKLSVKSKKSYPERAADVPVTQAMLYLVRDELKADLRGNQAEVKETKTSLGARIDGVEKSLTARIDGVEASLTSRINQVESNLRADFGTFAAELTGKFERLQSEVHRVALLVEEQNARNAIVLDGLTSLFTRQDRLEHEFHSTKKS